MEHLYPMDEIFRLSGVSRHFIGDICFIPEWRIVFAFISKNASSLLKTYLSPPAGGVSTDNWTRNPHVHSGTGFMGVHQLGVPEMNRILTDVTIPKVVVGRNPADRLISGWRSRVQTWHLERYQNTRELVDWTEVRQKILGHAVGSHAAPVHLALSEEIPLEMLVDYVEATPSSQLDRHFAPQTFLCGADSIQFDLIGQVEELDSFIVNLNQMIGCELPPLGDRRLNATPEAIAAPTDLTSILRERIEKRFAEDYVYFGYSMSTELRA